MNGLFKRVGFGLIEVSWVAGAIMSMERDIGAYIIPETSKIKSVFHNFPI